jgi:hypothetical protein
MMGGPQLCRKQMARASSTAHPCTTPCVGRHGAPLRDACTEGAAVRIEGMAGRAWEHWEHSAGRVVIIC